MRVRVREWRWVLLCASILLAGTRPADAALVLLPDATVSNIPRLYNPYDFGAPVNPRYAWEEGTSGPVGSTAAAGNTYLWDVNAPAGQRFTYTAPQGVSQWQFRFFVYLADTPASQPGAWQPGSITFNGLAGTAPTISPTASYNNGGRYFYFSAVNPASFSFSGISVSIPVPSDAAGGLQFNNFALYAVAYNNTVTDVPPMLTVPEPGGLAVFAAAAAAPLLRRRRRLTA